MTTGLALAFGLPSEARTILVRLTTDYLKKARGTITAVAEAPLFADASEREVPVEAALTDAAGEVVARVTAHWRVGAARKAS